MIPAHLIENGSTAPSITNSFETLPQPGIPQSLLIWPVVHCDIVKKIHELPTPCLVVDLDRLDANLEKLSRYARHRNVALRPHAKTHKCVNIARKQLERGAAGVCVATIAEAEVMLRGGIRGLLITGEMVGEPKISRLARIMREAPDTMVVVDDPRNVDELQDAGRHSGMQFGVLIDLDVGQNRTGIQPGEPALHLAEHISRAKNLALRGICAYAGHVAHITGFEARRVGSRRALAAAVETRDLLLKHGHNVQLLTGASTGTYNIDSDIEGLTELQSGSYTFMDVEYRRIGGSSGTLYEDFSPSLFVLSTVIHRSGQKAIVDAGLKAFATDRPFGPEPLDLSGVQYEFAGDEHGRLILNDGDVELGEKL